MTIRTPIRLLAGAALVALTLVSLPPTHALAAANQGGPVADCLDSGGSWDYSTQTCGQKPCNVIVGTFWVRGGTSFIHNGRNYMCDGVTGRWERMPT
jgi:hypothetical protein